MKAKNLIVIGAVAVSLYACSMGNIDSHVEYDDSLETGAYFTASLEEVKKIVKKEIGPFETCEWEDEKIRKNTKKYWTEFEKDDCEWQARITVCDDKVVSVMLSTSGDNTGDAEDYEIESIVKIFSKISGHSVEDIENMADELINEEKGELYEDGIMLENLQTDSTYALEMVALGDES